MPPRSLAWRAEVKTNAYGMDGVPQDSTGGRAGSRRATTRCGRCRARVLLHTIECAARNLQSYAANE